MARRWGPGPVFAFELIAAARRRQVYVGRALFLLALLAGLTLAWGPSGRMFRNGAEVARVAEQFFAAVVLVQLSAVLLAAPAATAGAVCVDKGRGTLIHVLVTDLTAREIVLGKLGARLVPVLALMLCGLPVPALGGLLGGIDVAAAFGAYLVTAGVAVFGCALALLLSVWARKPHQALLPTYAILGAWVAVFPALAGLGWIGAPPTWTAAEALVALSNPFGAAEASGFDPAYGLREQGAFLAGTTLAALLLVGLATGRLRPVALGQASAPARRGRPGLPARLVALLPGPALDGNPVLWRESHRKRPSRWTGRFWSAYAALSGLASLAVIVLYFLSPLGDLRIYASYINAWGVAIGLLLLTVSATTALAEERDRGSLDVIMATPLPTRDIVLGKWWGTFAMVPRLAILPIWVTCALALISERWEGLVWMVALVFAASAAITSLGLALGTWVRHPGRAVTTGVVAFALMTVGWTLFVHAVGALRAIPFLSPRDAADKLLLADPYHAVRLTTEVAGRFGYGPHGYGSWNDWLAREPGWPLFWVTVYAGSAALLLLATLWTFDRCLGRVPERPAAAGPTSSP